MSRGMARNEKDTSAYFPNDDLISLINAAFARHTPLDRARYRPQQWSTRANWRGYDPGEGDHWNGFQCVRQMEEVPPEILLVPLVGHTHGHVVERQGLQSLIFGSRLRGAGYQGRKSGGELAAGQTAAFEVVEKPFDHELHA